MVVYDEYSNIVPIFPAEIIDQLSVTILGDQFTVEKPLVLDSKEILGNELTFIVASDHVLRYQYGLFRTVPY